MQTHYRKPGLGRPRSYSWCSAYCPPFCYPPLLPESTPRQRQITEADLAAAKREREAIAAQTAFLAESREIAQAHRAERDSEDRRGPATEGAIRIAHREGGTKVGIFS